MQETQDIINILTELNILNLLLRPPLSLLFNLCFNSQNLRLHPISIIEGLEGEVEGGAVAEGGGVDEVVGFDGVEGHLDVAGELDLLLILDELHVVVLGNYLDLYFCFVGEVICEIRNETLN